MDADRAPQLMPSVRRLIVYEFHYAAGHLRMKVIKPLVGQRSWSAHLPGEIDV
jgi:hypothetical protein